MTLRGRMPGPVLVPPPRPPRSPRLRRRHAAVLCGIVAALLIALALGARHVNSDNSVAGTAAPPRLDFAPRGPAPRLDGREPPPAFPAGAWILVDEASGQVLAESNSSARRAPASVTKIATAVLLLERGHLDDVVTIDLDFTDLEYDATVMGITAGDRFTFRDLLYGLMLRSGNDAAIAIARAMARDEPNFVAAMNALAVRLDLRDTHFTDSHGLGGPDHYTSARDLARLTRYAFTLPGFAEVVSTKEWHTAGSQQIELWNSNLFLYGYDGADGVKIGYTEQAGRTIVASASRDGHRLIAVILDDQRMEAHAAALMDWGWEHACWPDGSSCRRAASPVPTP